MSITWLPMGRFIFHSSLYLWRFWEFVIFVNFGCPMLPCSTITVATYYRSFFVFDCSRGSMAHLGFDGSSFLSQFTLEPFLELVFVGLWVVIYFWAFCNMFAPFTWNFALMTIKINLFYITMRTFSNRSLSIRALTRDWGEFCRAIGPISFNLILAKRLDLT